MNKQIKLGRIKTSKIELIDISKAWLALSLAFAFAFSGVRIFSPEVLSFSFGFVFVVSLFTAGIGFLLHELGHKFVAQHYGCVAEFRASDQMLYLAVGLAAFAGFIFAAPGAVMIAGQITRRENGIISAAGPAVNFVLGICFLLLAKNFVAWSSIFMIGFQINMWLGLFNMIPFWLLDGKKIFAWDPKIWAVMTAIGGYFVFLY